MLRVRAARPATKPDTRLKSQLPSSSCARGAPRMVPVFGGERFLRPSCRASTRGCGQQFQNFLAVHKISTVQRELSPRWPGFSTGSPQVKADRCRALGPLSRLRRTGHGSSQNLRDRPHTIRRGTTKRRPDTTKGRTPPRMRWRGPPDLAAQTPLTHAQRPYRLTSHQAGYPLEVPVAQFLLRPGCPPDGSRFRR